MTTSPADRAPPLLSIKPYPGGAPLSRLVTPQSSSARPYHDGLAAGRLTLQRCISCGKRRWPMAPVCPYCDGLATDWVEASGQGEVVSFVRYPRAHLPEFERVAPYAVVCAQLLEGPRLFARLAQDGDVWIGRKVQAIIEQWDDGGLAPAFVFADGGR